MTTDAVGGVWTYSLELARALRAYGVKIALATMGPLPTPDQCAEAEAIDSVTLCASDYKLEWMDDPWEDVERAGEWLMDLEQREQPDLVHLNGYAHGSLDWSAPCLVVGHSCVLSWWEAVKGEPASNEWDRYRQVVSEGLRAAKLVLAPTKAMLAALNQHYGPLGESQVVPNARDRARFSPGRKQDLILSAGRVWDEAKNIAILEKIAPRLHWPVYVAGEQEHPESGRVHLANVRRLGRLGATELRQWYARASIYALPARYEPFGLSALEAALCGCALVLGDIPSLREVWGDAALFAPPNDGEALEHAINRLIADPLRLNEMSDRAWMRAREYTPERMAREYMVAVSSLVAAGQGIQI